MVANLCEGSYVQGFAFHNTKDAMVQAMKVANNACIINSIPLMVSVLMKTAHKIRVVYRLQVPTHVGANVPEVSCQISCHAPLRDMCRMPV